jgi:hypothetical protein
MFATSYDGVSGLLVGAPVITVLLGLISFLPASRGHWSALFLSIPCTLFSFVMVFSFRPADCGLLFWLPFLAGCFVGIASFCVWYYKASKL